MNLLQRYLDTGKAQTFWGKFHGNSTRSSARNRTSWRDHPYWRPHSQELEESRGYSPILISAMKHVDPLR
jgi:hypothetical protein